MKVEKANGFRKQSGLINRLDTSIVWRERESGVETTLNFQEAEGCDVIWFGLL